ncbi:type II secretion system minor pseudopilin GspK [Comamonas odontotermitis]|uniref:type II secretion system minor pseudopilin GspK n=1 Tax=Comamonas odontotermitis TaxID=379895 RepID=UPI001CC5787B|nr:type II secretion system minor pseudopilin GspK [Comamonas odontotermitis]UBB16655.1 type II secretion system minor pseudopilin GspK [Comamonas odontotermitis]
MRYGTRLGQRGAALLAAMLTVTLVATIAASAVWQQWRNLEVEGAERTRVQAAWLLLGGLDFSRQILRHDARTSGGTDSLTEPWSVPLAEARLSTFLQATNNQTNVDDATIDAAQAFLSGAVVDAQARLNIRNLVSSNALNPTARRQFERLFERLGLPSAELTLLSQQALAALRSEGKTANAPLLPRTYKELAWWGLSPATLAALEPYVTLLPQTSLVNINTASPTVIWAAVDGLDFATAQQIAQMRTTKAFENTTDIKQRFPNNQALSAAIGLLDVRTAYFEVWARLRFDDLVVQEKSLVYRQGLSVSTVVRERGAAMPASLLAEGSSAFPGGQ